MAQTKYDIGQMVLIEAEIKSVSIESNRTRYEVYASGCRHLYGELSGSVMMVDEELIREEA